MPSKNIILHFPNLANGPTSNPQIFLPTTRTVESLYLRIFSSLENAPVTIATTVNSEDPGSESCLRLSIVPIRRDSDETEVGVGVGGVASGGGQVGLTHKPVKAFLGVVVRGIVGLDVGALQPNIQPKPLNSPHRFLSSPASPSAPSSSSFSISSSATASPSFSTSNLKVETEGVLLSRITISYKLSMYEKEELHGPWILTDSVLTQGTGSGNNSMVRQLYCN